MVQPWQVFFCVFKRNTLSEPKFASCHPWLDSKQIFWAVTGNAKAAVALAAPAAAAVSIAGGKADR